MRVLIGMVAIPLCAQWLPQHSPVTASLRGLSAVSNKTAWASGTKGTFLRTIDGGANWLSSSVAGAEALDFRDVQAFDADVAYLLSSGPGRQSRIYQTIDGGTHWSLLFENTEEQGFFDAIGFWDRERGLVLGDPVAGRFTILRTSDGGRSWRPPDACPPARSGEGAFAASGTCLAVGAGGYAWFGTGGPGGARVFRSIDWGRTWTASETPVRHEGSAAGIFSVGFRDALHGIAVGGDYTKPSDDRANVAVTDDGGLTWTTPPGQRPSGYRSAVILLGKTGALATGPSGTDASTDGGHNWHRTSNRGYNAMSFANARTGWAAGGNGRIARYRRSLRAH